jgi:hypothetical protein
MEERPYFTLSRTALKSRATEGAVTAVLDLIRCGNSRTAACAAAGIPRTTFHDWIKAGEELVLALQDGLILEEELTERERVLVGLRAGLYQAYAQAETWHVQNIRNHAEGDWKASAWWLERARPESFGKQSRVEHTGRGGGPIQVQPVPMEAALKQMTDDEILQLQALEVRARRSISAEERDSEEIPS